jgi:hypothetical protein
LDQPGLLGGCTGCSCTEERTFRGSGPPRTAELENSVRQHTQIHRAPVHTEIVCLRGRGLLSAAIFSTCKQITEQLNRGEAAIAFSKRTLLETTAIHRSPRKYHMLVPPKTHQWKCAMCVRSGLCTHSVWLARSKGSFGPNLFVYILETQVQIHGCGCSSSVQLLVPAITHWYCSLPLCLLS